MEAILLYLADVWYELMMLLGDPLSWVIMIVVAVAMGLTLYFLNDLTKTRTQVLTFTTILFLIGLNVLVVHRFGRPARDTESFQILATVMGIGIFFLIGLHIAHFFTQLRQDPVGIPLRWLGDFFTRIGNSLYQRADKASHTDKMNQVVNRVGKVIDDAVQTAAKS